jgi:hypothetical protein
VPNYSLRLLLTQRPLDKAWARETTAPWESGDAAVPRHFNRNKQHEHRKKIQTGLG